MKEKMADTVAEHLRATSDKEGQGVWVELLLNLNFSINTFKFYSPIHPLLYFL